MALCSRSLTLDSLNHSFVDNTVFPVCAICFGPRILTDTLPYRSIPLVSLAGIE